MEKPNELIDAYGAKRLSSYRTSSPLSLPSLLLVDPTMNLFHGGGEAIEFPLAASSPMTPCPEADEECQNINNRSKDEQNDGGPHMCQEGSEEVGDDEDGDRLRAQRKKRRLGISVFVDPIEDHPDNHLVRHLNLCAANVPVRDKSRRLTQLLQSHPLFRSLSPEITRRVHNEFIHEVKHGGSVLFTAGEYSDVFYLVDDGEVDCVYSEDGVSTVLRKTAGDTLGDLALMQPCASAQTFTARIASVAVSLYSIEGGIFRFLLQNGMQLRYGQLKTFFQGLPLFANLPYPPSHQSELIENLIENAQILEFHAGDVIIPASDLTTTRSDQVMPLLEDDESPTFHLRASEDPSPTPSCPSSTATQVRTLTSSSSFTLALADSIPFSDVSPSSSPSSPPSYLANCVFLVKDGLVSVRRPLSKPSLERASTDPTSNNVAHAHCEQVGDGDMFGLEILSCAHRLLDLPSKASSPILAPSAAPSRGVDEYPMTRVGSGATTSPSSRSRSALHRKRGRCDSDSEEDQSGRASPAINAHSNFFTPGVISHLNGSNSISPVDKAIRDCACRGEVRCKSTAAIVIAIDAKIWKNVLIKSI